MRRGSGPGGGRGPARDGWESRPPRCGPRSSGRPRRAGAGGSVPGPPPLFGTGTSWPSGPLGARVLPACALAGFWFGFLRGGIKEHEKQALPLPGLALKSFSLYFCRRGSPAVDLTDGRDLVSLQALVFYVFICVLCFVPRAAPGLPGGLPSEG